MKRLNIVPISQTYPDSAPCNTIADAKLSAEFDTLVQRAAQGDAHAIGAIAIALGPWLLDVARDVSGNDDGAVAVLNDFFDAMHATGTPSSFPEPGRALAWLEGAIRSAARGKLEGSEAA